MKTCAAKGVAPSSRVAFCNASRVASALLVRTLTPWAARMLSPTAILLGRRELLNSRVTGRARQVAQRLHYGRVYVARVAAWAGESCVPSARRGRTHALHGMGRFHDEYAVSAG